MGDFYELFFDDAVRAAAALDIALTKRGEHQGEPIPMCGVPAATAEAYLARLIKAGFKVAVGEQTEDPKAAKARGGAKAVVKRAITRIVTPGTLTEDSLLDPRAANRIACVAQLPSGEAAIAWAEVSTGEFAVCRAAENTLNAELAAMNPAELLVEESRFGAFAGVVQRATLTPLPRAKFDVASAERQLKAQFDVQELTGLRRLFEGRTRGIGRAARLSRPLPGGGAGQVVTAAPRPARAACWRSTPRHAPASRSTGPCQESVRVRCWGQ